MGTRLESAKRRPTAASRRSGILLQLGLGIVVVIRLPQTRPAVAVFVAAVSIVAAGLVVWWSLGKWFSLVLYAEVFLMPGAGLMKAHGFPWAPELVVEFLLFAPAVVVGFVAGRMERYLTAPVDFVAPASVEVPGPELDELSGAGFRAEPDLVYDVRGFKTVVAVFAHPLDPMYAAVVVRPMAKPRPFIFLVSHLGGGAALETQNQCTAPNGPRRLRQAFAGAGVTTLAHRHLEALAWLGARGITARPADVATYPADLDGLLDDTTESIRAHPLRSAAWALVLLLRHRNLDEGPVQDHADVTERVQVVLDGLR